MKEKTILVSSIILSFAIVVLGVCYLAKPIGTVFAGVPIGNEYHSTSTRAFNGNILTNGTVLFSGSGALGTVTITGANTGIITLYDATSTVTNTQWATTTLAQFPASTAAGTYVFDVIVQKGLYFEYSGLAPTTTISFRQ